MTSKIIRYTSFFFLMFFTQCCYGVLDVVEGDEDLSKQIPLISGAAHLTEEIRKGNTAAITICTTPLSVGEGCGGGRKVIDHVALVFELNLRPSPENQNIDLLLVQFGDGTGSKPLIEGRKETLIKVYRGQQINEVSQESHYVDPIYSRKLTIFTNVKGARNALLNAENDENLVYSIGGGGWFQNTYNCCTYASKLLEDAGIDVNFRSNWGSSNWLSTAVLKHATNLVQSYKPHGSEPKDYKDYCNTNDINWKNGTSEKFFEEVYVSSLEKCLARAQDAFDRGNYEASLEHLHEAAKKGHLDSIKLIDILVIENIEKAHNIEGFQLKHFLISAENFYETRYFKQRLKTIKSHQWLPQTVDHIENPESEKGFTIPNNDDL